MHRAPSTYGVSTANGHTSVGSGEPSTACRGAPTSSATAMRSSMPSTGPRFATRIRNTLGSHAGPRPTLGNDWSSLFRFELLTADSQHFDQLHGVLMPVTCDVCLGRGKSQKVSATPRRVSRVTARSIVSPLKPVVQTIETESAPRIGVQNPGP